MNHKIFHQIIDSGADISVIPRHVVHRLGLEEESIDAPFPVYGFQSSSSSSVLVSTKCNVPTDLGCGLLPVTFFVADIQGEYALLGSDVLSDESSGFEFESSSGIVKFDGNLFYTKKSSESSIAELRRREKMGTKNYHHHNASIHAAPTMRNSRRVTIGPRTMGWIDAYVSRHVRQSHSFLSFYAEDEDPISIPYFHFYKSQHRYRLPVINDTSNHFTFPAGQILGDVVQHLKPSAEDEHAASIFHAISGRNLDPKQLLKKREEMISGIKDSEVQQHQSKQAATSSEQHQQQQQHKTDPSATATASAANPS